MFGPINVGIKNCPTEKSERNVIMLFFYPGLVNDIDKYFFTIGKIK